MVSLFTQFWHLSSSMMCSIIPLVTTLTVSGLKVTLSPPQSLGLALVHAHTRLAAEQPGHNRTAEGPIAKRLEGGGAMFPLKLTR